MDTTLERGDQTSGEKPAQGYPYPEESRLIARGKFSTLNHERREQIKRVQAIVTTITSEAHGVLRDCQRDGLKAPHEPQRMESLTKCLENLNAARRKITELCEGLQALEGEAWG